MRLLTFFTSTLFVLTACELPGKIGDLPTGGDTDDSSTAGSSGTSGDSDGTTTKATTDGPQTTSTGEPETTTGEPQTTSSTDTMTTGAMTTGGGVCEGLDEQACLAEPGCMTYHGIAYDFEGCQPGDAYLGCGPALECDQAFTGVCRDGTDEAYLAPISCLPPGFSACDLFSKSPCDGGCGVMDEAACTLFMGDFCEPIHGLPYVEKDGNICIDPAPKFITCASIDGVCPPFVPTVCNDAMPAEQYDIPSGCIPPNFSECDAGGASLCE